MSSYVYANTSTLGVGTILCTDGARTTRVVDGWYSDGNYAYYVSGGQGVIQSYTVCCPAAGTVLGYTCNYYPGCDPYSDYAQYAQIANGSCGYDLVFAYCTSMC